MAQEIDDEPPHPGRALQRIAVDAVDHAIACLQLRGAAVHRGVHQARKSLRRARAVLRLGGESLGPDAAAVDEELRELVRGLSQARDADALVKTLDRLLRREDRDAERAVLRRARAAAVRARTAVLRAALADDPDFGRRRDRLLQAAAALGGLPWETLTSGQLLAVVEAAGRRVDKAAQRAQDSGRDEDWHRWRRRERRLVQKQRLLAGIGLPVEIERRHKALARALGQAQDYALLRAHCGRGSPFDRDDRPKLKRLADAGLAKLRGRIARAR
ncbi:MAG TPA: CHAD domain-containing protein [Luteimonas sp.]|nr:CHAD domain-containing protein [Luteimonas sp.]